MPLCLRNITEPAAILKNKITCYNNKLHALEFAIVSETPEISETAEKRAINAYIYFHLAIRPNVNVIIFFIEPDTPVGARLYGENEKTPNIYHIPPERYNQIHNYVDTAYCVVSIPLLKECIERNQLHNNIFDWLATQHHENGLIVLGVFDEIEEAS